MKILIFLHGTILMHKNALGKAREERVQQIKNKDFSIYDFKTYIPVGASNRKLYNWAHQGAEIFYLSSKRTQEDIKKDMFVLDKYDFPKGKILFREGDQSYKDITESIIPDVLIEDDCESIGGVSQMVYFNISNTAKENIKSIVVKEFGGIDHLPDAVDELNKINTHSIMELI